MTVGDVFCVYNQKSKSLFGNNFFIRAVYLFIKGSIIATQRTFHPITNISSQTSLLTGNFSNNRTIHGNAIIQNVATIILKITWVAATCFFKCHHSRHHKIAVNVVHINAHKSNIIHIR